MKKILFFVLSIFSFSSAYAGNWAIFNSSGELISYGFSADTRNPIKPTAPITIDNPLLFNITVNMPSGATALTDAQYAAIPNLALVNGQVTIVTPQGPQPPSLAQQAAAELAGGITITSTSTSSLNGTYSLSGDAQQNINAIVTYILANGDFPGNSATYTYLDQSGAPHVFPNTQAFKSFATAAANLVSELKTVQLTNSGTLPPETATIP